MSFPRKRTVGKLRRRGKPGNKTPAPPFKRWRNAFGTTAAHAETFPSRADAYSDVMRIKLEAAQRASRAEVRAAYRAIEEWRRYRPDVDLYVSPCYAVELPPEDADELEVRLPLTSFLRWVNLIGWAGLAIGNLQLIAPADETVLAAGLLWEREYALPVAAR